MQVESGSDYRDEIKDLLGDHCFSPIEEKVICHVINNWGFFVKSSLEKIDSKGWFYFYKGRIFKINPRVRKKQVEQTLFIPVQDILTKQGSFIERRLEGEKVSDWSSLAQQYNGLFDCLEKERGGEKTFVVNQLIKNWETILAKSEACGVNLTSRRGTKQRAFFDPSLNKVLVETNRPLVGGSAKVCRQIEDLASGQLYARLTSLVTEEGRMIQIHSEKDGRRVITPLASCKKEAEVAVSLFEGYAKLNPEAHNPFIPLYGHNSYVGNYLGKEASKYYWITPYCSLGDAFDLLSYNHDLGPGKRLSQDVFLHIILTLVNALNFMDKKGIRHNDIKLENILITEDWQPIITDYGAASINKNAKILGTLEYGSPSLLNLNEERLYRWCSNPDRWALGCIAFSFICPYDFCLPPWHKIESRKDLRNYLAKLTPKDLLEFISNQNESYCDAPVNKNPIAVFTALLWLGFKDLDKVLKCFLDYYESKNEEEKRCLLEKEWDNCVAYAELWQSQNQ